MNSENFYKHEPTLSVHKYRELLELQTPRKINHHLNLDPKFYQFGWLWRLLIKLDALIWSRWAYWLNLKFIGELPYWNIPQIEFYSGGRGDNADGSPARKHIEECLNLIPKSSHWRSWSCETYINYFLDWLLFGLGHRLHEPKEPQGCEGAAARLYQYFNLDILVGYPWDYFGGILSEMQIGKNNGFYPTPHNSTDLTVQLLYNPNIDNRLTSVCEPCVGTGRMLLYASNNSLLLYGQEINLTCLKACLVNLYLYAPWGAMQLYAIKRLAKTTSHVTEFITVRDCLIKFEGITKDFVNQPNKLANFERGTF